MSVAREAAPEIDRLVFGVMGSIGPRHGAAIRDITAGLGLDSMGFLSVLAEHLAAGPMNDDFIDLRLKYGDAHEIRAVLSDMEALQLLDRNGDRWAATERVRPLLDAVIHARAETAGAVWMEQDVAVAALLEPARQVAMAASPEHELAVIYRELPEPEATPALLLRRLRCLRYVRHHCHVQAWRAEGLDGSVMPALTTIWNGQQLDDDADLGPLREAGLVEGDPPHLTDSGQAKRDRIEDYTNAAAQVTFDILGGSGGERFLEALRSL